MKNIVEKTSNTSMDSCLFWAFYIGIPTGTPSGARNAGFWRLQAPETCISNISGLKTRDAKKLRKNTFEKIKNIDNIITKQKKTGAGWGNLCLPPTVYDPLI